MVEPQTAKKIVNFRPQHFRWIIIKNRHYHNLRTYEQCGKFADLDAVDDDARNVRNGVFGLGAKRLDIQEIEDANFEDFSALIKEL